MVFKIYRNLFEMRQTYIRETCLKLWKVQCVCVACCMCVYMMCPCCQPPSGGLVIHHRGSVLSGVANGNSPVLDHVVETRLPYSFGLQPSNRATTRS